MKPLRVLVVEDREDDALLLVDALEEAGYELHWRRVETAEEMRETLLAAPYDLVVSDWSMPRFSGIDAFQVLKEVGLDLPFIIVSGTIGEEIAVKALKSGVHDFMTKGMFARLGPAVERELREAKLRHEQRETRREIERQREDTARSARLLRLVIDSVPDSVLFVDASGHFVLWNRAAERIFGPLAAAPPIDEGISASFGLFLTDMKTPHPVEELPIVRALSGIDSDGHEFAVKNPHAPQGILCSCSARSLHDGSGAVTGAVAVVRDVTQDKLTQEQLLLSDRLASMGMLCAGVGHEINNPLAAVLGNLEMLREKLGADVPPAVIDMLEEARSSAERVRTIARDLRVFARHEAETVESVEVCAVIESSLRMAWNEMRHRAQVVRELGSPVHVLGSESRLAQVFLNLLINAAHAIPEGNAQQNQVSVRIRADADKVMIEVADTGTGMTAETKRRLFTPFFTTKPKNVGTGLGLMICHRIVTGIGGELDVETELGKGSTFRVTLKRATPDATPAAEPSAPSPVSRRGRVLAIDDEVTMVNLIRRVLGAAHEVVTETRATAALDRIVSGERFDVILCDMMMPQMTGMEFYEELKRVAPDAVESVVFLTGGAFTASAISFLEQVPNQKMEKPLDAIGLRGVVARRIRPEVDR